MVSDSRVSTLKLALMNKSWNDLNLERNDVEPFPRPGGYGDAAMDDRTTLAKWW